MTPEQKKEARKAYRRQWCDERNPKEAISYTKEYRQEYYRQYYRRNREKLLEYSKKWQQDQKPLIIEV